jgi:capsule polysaccharide export protein KpsE/RkpR
MRNSSFAEIGKILVRLNDLNSEIKSLRAEKNHIVTDINNKRIAVLFDGLDDLKDGLARYQQLKADNIFLHQQLKTTMEQQRVISKKIFEQPPGSGESRLSEAC